MNMNSNRRDFLKGVGVVAALSAFGGCASALCGRCRPQLAAQLYSIHKIFWKRPE